MSGGDRAPAEDLNLDRTFIVSDCKTTIDDIREGTLGRNGSIISEIRSRSTNLRECSFTFEVVEIQILKHTI
jgi:hypothetical protein